MQKKKVNHFPTVFMFVIFLALGVFMLFTHPSPGLTGVAILSDTRSADTKENVQTSLSTADADLDSKVAPLTKNPALLLKEKKLTPLLLKTKTTDSEDSSDDTATEDTTDQDALVSAVSCNSSQYTDVTAKILQRLNVSSTGIYEIKKLDFQHMSVVLYNADTHKLELYLYDLGNDRLFDTADDQGYLLESQFYKFSYQDAYDISKGLTLFWHSYSNNSTNLSLPPNQISIKGCGISSSGCTPVTLTTFPFTPTILGSYDLVGMVYSSSQNRLYLYLNTFQGGSITGTIMSCSLQPGALDFCMNGLSSYTVHKSNLEGSLENTLPETGFIYSDLTRAPFIFSVETKASTALYLASNLDLKSAKAYAPPLFLAVHSQMEIVNFTPTYVPKVTILDATNSTFMFEVESLTASNSYLLDVDTNSIATIYQPLYTPIILGKRIGQDPTEIFDVSSLPQYSNLQTENLLPDGSLLAILDKISIVRYDCKLD